MIRIDDAVITADVLEQKLDGAKEVEICPRAKLTPLARDYLQANHILHHYSSYYRPQSNSPAERGVRSIKDVISKLPGFTERSLHAVVFAINQHQAADGSGSPSERFLKRNIRSNLPRIMTKELTR